MLDAVAAASPDMSKPPRTKSALPLKRKTSK
jgi:hypothetical protein